MSAEKSSRKASLKCFGIGGWGQKVCNKASVSNEKLTISSAETDREAKIVSIQNELTMDKVRIALFIIYRAMGLSISYWYQSESVDPKLGQCPSGCAASSRDDMTGGPAPNFDIILATEKEINRFCK